MSVELKTVSHGFGGALVLRGIDLHISGGESIAVMGPSGSGKTTLLAICGLLLQPTTGTVLIDGRGVSGTESRQDEIRRKNFAWIFQSMNVLPRRSTVENVALPLLTAGADLESAHTAARHITSAVGLADLADRAARTLSGGELQRMCIARAFVSRPPVVLADEPTGQLDASTTGSVLDFLFDLTMSSGIGLLVATHDESVGNRCNRIVRLENGKLVQGS